MREFLTVNKTSSDRLIDVPATFCANLTDGDDVYVSSLKCEWVWDVSFPSGSTADNITVCRPSAWKANGAFTRCLEGVPVFLRQATWFVDTAGNDENDGLTAQTPVQTDSEIQRRWGLGTQAIITTAVTITYAQAPVGLTSYRIEVAGGSVSLNGTPTVSKAGTVVSAVQAQVRTAGSEAGWAITGTGLGATEVGKLAVITASTNPGNVGAYAAILKDETAGKVRIAPFAVYNTANTATTIATPLVGDVIEIRAPMTLNIGLIEIHSSHNEITTIAGKNRFTCNDIALEGNSTLSSSLEAHGNVSFVCVRSSLNGLTVMGSGQISINLRGGIVGALGVNARTSGNLSLLATGCFGQVQATYGSAVTVASDTYFQNCALLASRGGVVNSQGAAFFDRSVSNAALNTTPGGLIQQTGATPDWGTNNAGHGITVQSGSGYSYVTKPTINGTLGAGREAQVGGTDKLYSAIPYVEATNNAFIVLTA